MKKTLFVALLTVSTVVSTASAVEWFNNDGKTAEDSCFTTNSATYDHPEEVVDATANAGGTRTNIKLQSGQEGSTAQTASIGKVIVGDGGTLNVLQSGWSPGNRLFESLTIGTLESAGTANVYIEGKHNVVIEAVSATLGTVANKGGNLNIAATSTDDTTIGAVTVTNGGRTHLTIDNEGHTTSASNDLTGIDVELTSGTTLLGTDLRMASLTLNGTSEVKYEPYYYASLTVSDLIISAGADASVTKRGNTSEVWLNTLTLTGDAALTSALHFNGDASMSFGGTLTLNSTVDFSGVGTIYIVRDFYDSLVNAGTEGELMTMTGYSNGTGVYDLYITEADGSHTAAGHTYLRDNGNGSYSLMTPEPATTTLSLLALAGLAARRKRH